MPDQILPASDLGHVHFVGLGGAALSGLARIMHARGIAVSGSDAADSAALAGLRELGITAHVGHAAEQVDQADTVVVSVAIGDDNPEVAEARRRGLRIWPRSAAVASLLLGHRAVVVTGTHGKTTTTSMLATALLACGADPSYAIGSTLTASGLNAAHGGGDIFVAEGDESDAAINVYSPAGAVVTNVDVDHLDFFGSREAYAAVFDEFVARIDPSGFCVCIADDPGAARVADLAQGRGLRVVRVGTEAGESAGVSLDLTVRDVRVEGGWSRALVWQGDVSLGELRLSVPGRTFMLDAVAALAAGLELGFGFAPLAAGLADFRGSARRMERKGLAAGVEVYDSYAHHPTELRSDLEAARSLTTGRLIACFQPHLFSRTLEFADQMGAELGAADEAIVLDVYPAREEPIPGVTGQLVADAVPHERSAYTPEAQQAVDRILDVARPGDLVVTLGAGNVTDLGPRLLRELEATTGEENPA